MSQASKPNSKVNILFFLVGGISFVLVIAGLFILIHGVKAATSLYDFSSEAGVSRWTYEKGGDQPINPNNYDSLVSDYSTLYSSDNARLGTFLAEGGLWDSQIYTFELNEGADSIMQLDLFWEGYGETCIGYNTYFYIWNINSNNWEELEYQTSPGGDITLQGSISSNVSYYVDSGSNNQVSLMTTSQEIKSLGEDCINGSECCSGYCADGVCCNGLCNGECERCDDYDGTAGTCHPVALGHDPDGDCDPDTETQNQGCQERAKDGNCNGSGSCNDFGGWYAINIGGTCLSGEPHCSDDLYYDGYACSSGGECIEDDNLIGCCAGSGCSGEDEYCRASDHSCQLAPACHSKKLNDYGTDVVIDGVQDAVGVNTCDGTCEACYGGSCGNAGTAEDPGGKCSISDCYTGYCDGNGACGYYTSGEGSCPECQTCDGATSGSCMNMNGVKDDQGANVCNGECKICQTGSCGNVPSGEDPLADCGTDNETQNRGCQERAKDGNCSGSGACNDFGGWEDRNEGELCWSNEHCSGDVYYSGYFCNAGNCNGDYENIGCCAGSYCEAEQYCELASRTCQEVEACHVKVDSGYGTELMENGVQDTEGSNLCSDRCKACYDGSCETAPKGTDPGGYCSYGSGSSNGCRLGYCSGNSDACAVLTGGRGACPSCQRCSDSDIACEYEPNNTYDSRCSTCQKCLNGSCSVATTEWGAAQYGCSGSSQRCVNGSCKTCQLIDPWEDSYNVWGGGGYLYDDGCGGCAGQGGRACWYIGFYEHYQHTTCNDICQDHGAVCVNANWHDSNCNVVWELVPQVFDCTGCPNSPHCYYACGRAVLGTTCDYGTPPTTYECCKSSSCNQYIEWAYTYEGSPLYIDGGDTMGQIDHYCCSVTRKWSVNQDCDAPSDPDVSDTQRKRLCVCSF